MAFSPRKLYLDSFGPRKPIQTCPSNQQKAHNLSFYVIILFYFNMVQIWGRGVSMPTELLPLLDFPKNSDLAISEHCFLAYERIWAHPCPALPSGCTNIKLVEWQWAILHRFAISPQMKHKITFSINIFTDNSHPAFGTAFSLSVKMYYEYSAQKLPGVLTCNYFSD